MNKKMLSIIGLSSVFLFGSVYSISANTSGYELYKEALKQTHELQSTTMDVHFQLEDNGKDLFTSNTNMKTNKDSQLMNSKTTMTNGEETSETEMFRQDGQWYVKKSGEDQLYKMTAKKRHTNPDSQKFKELQEDLEKLVDVATKNLQQKMTVKDSVAGGKKVQLAMSKSEIPLAANVVTSLMVKHAAIMNDSEKSNSKDQFHHVKPTLPELKQEINITKIEIIADIHPDNYVVKQTVHIAVSGKDANGKLHNLEMNFEIELSKVNDTQVSPNELLNQNLEIIEVKHGH